MFNEQEIKETTEDWLISIRGQINRELARRKEEPKKRIWKVVLNNEQSVDYFKDYKKAIEAFIDDVDHTVSELHNKMSIESEMISETEYNLRPDQWYG